MELLFVILGVVVLVILVAGTNKKSNKVSNKGVATYHYKRKDYMMTRSESEFFNILTTHFGDKHYIFPQVNISSILDHTVKGQDWRAARAHINRMSVDYVICTKSSVKPLLAIELDDPTHNREDRQKRDADVNRIFEEASLPLVRFSNINQLSNDEITQRIFDKIID